MTQTAATAGGPVPPNRRQMKLEPWQDPSEEPYVRIEGVTKKFGDFTAVDNVSVSIYRSELFSLLGGSGCGKTTLLRMLAGFERPTSGRIFIDGVDMSDIPPYDRPVNMMFQSYALFPHMTVEQNVAFGLRQDRLPSAEIRHRVDEALELVKLIPQRKRKPHQLSGGQRQRVALARSLIKRPKLLLLDEPLAALDRKLREETQFELVNIQEQVGITSVMVTHDQEEAMTMSTRIAVMDAGWIVQVGTPAEVYEYPQTRFVAEFIGQVNLFEGLVIEDAQDHIIVACEAEEAELLITHSASLPVGTRVNVAVRPEKMTISKQPPADRRNSLSGVVEEIAYLGNFSTYLIRLANDLVVRVTAPNITRMTELPVTWEDHVHVSWPAYAGVILPV